jgi:uncharacterized protein (TIGR03067 family)
VKAGNLGEYRKVTVIMEGRFCRAVLAQILDEELSRMPERYRAPVLLCCLAGKTQEQAARELGWPLGSMSRWLTRGKEMLRKRLARRGITVSAPLLGTALAGLSAEAGPAPMLAATTVKAAVGSFAGITAGLVSARVAALTEGGLRTMLVTKMTFTKVLLLLVGLTATGAGVLAYQKGGPGGGPPQGPGVGAPGRNALEAPGPVGAGAPAVAGLGGIPQGVREERAPGPNEAPKSGFVKAEVSVLMTQEGKRVETPLRLTLTDQGYIDHLAKYFPQMGQGKVGDAAGGWKAGLLITFYPAKGDPLKVSVHWEGDVWSEGKGDWDTSQNLWEFVLERIAEEDRRQLLGTWKFISIEENGKKRPDAQVRDLRWTIQWTRIIYWQNDRRIIREFQLDPACLPKIMDLTRDPKDPAPQFDLAPGVSEERGTSSRAGGSYARGGTRGGGMGPGGMGGRRPGLPGMMGGPGGMMGGAAGYPCIYALDGDDLRICESFDLTVRPTDFTAKEKSNRILYILKRDKEARPAVPAEPEKRPNEPAGVWSKPVNGLSGRLLVAFENLKPGLRHVVMLELKNVSTKPLAILNQPKLDVALTDTNGLVIPTESFPMSGPIPNPQWATLPREAYLGFRVDMTTVGVPAKERALLAVGGKMWGLKPGSYTLRVKVSPEDTNHNDAWGGDLELPPVEVLVTKEQVTQP